MSAALKQLKTLAQLWLDPAYPLRQQAELEAAAEFALSPASFRLVLNWIFELWLEAEEKVLERIKPYQRYQQVAQILAGTTPAMIAQGFFQGALLERPQIIKIPRQQKIFASLLYQSLKQHCPELAAYFTLYDEDLAAFHQALAKADFVVAYGSDETLSSLKHYLAPEAHYLCHGAVSSAALVLKEADGDSALQHLAYDFLSYDQRGCLSPRVCFVEGDARVFAQRFAQEVLPAFSKRYPRGSFFAGEAAAILHQRNLYAFRGEVYAGEDWTLCYEESEAWPALELPRFLVVKPWRGLASLAAQQKPLKALGVAGDYAPLQTVTAALLLPLGQMQRQLLVF